jgi:hypothetical protein
MERFVEAFAPCGFTWDAFYPGYGLRSDAHHFGQTAAGLLSAQG